MKERDSALNEDIRSSNHKFLQAVRDHSNLPTAGTSKPEPCAPKQDGFLEKNYARADPSYLKTLGQAHSGWIFGAIAELVDNSRDAKATKLVGLSYPPQFSPLNLLWFGTCFRYPPYWFYYFMLLCC